MCYVIVCGVVLLSDVPSNDKCLICYEVYASSQVARAWTVDISPVHAYGYLFFQDASLSDMMAELFSLSVYRTVQDGDALSTNRRFPIIPSSLCS